MDLQTGNLIDAGKVSLQIAGAITDQLQKNVDTKIYDDDLQKKVKPTAADKSVKAMGVLMYS